MRLLLALLLLVSLSGCAVIRESLGHFGIHLASSEDLGAFGSALTGCSAEEKRPYEMDAEKEYFFGRAIGARMLGDLGAEPLPPDHPTARYVDRVGQLLALSALTQSEALVEDRADVDFSRDVEDRPWPLTGYRFVVLRMDEPNAFGSPGGLVTITTGLLAQLRDEDELAAVLAHEVVHVHRGHGVEVMKGHLCQSAAKNRAARVAGDTLAQGAQNLAGGAFRGQSSAALGDMLEDAVNGVLGVFSAGYPKTLELEADRMAVRLLAGAGYSLDAFGELLARMQREAKGRDKYMQTHPSFADRLETVDPAIARYSAVERRRPPGDVSLRAERFRASVAQLSSAASP